MHEHIYFPMANQETLIWNTVKYIRILHKRIIMLNNKVMMPQRRNYTLRTVNGKRYIDNLLPDEELMPFVESSDGSRYWHIDGILHRDDGPAIENAQVHEWWLNGRRHREDGPAIEYLTKSKYEWYLDGQRHRLYHLPAVEGDTLKWYSQNKMHREFGLPATINSDGRDRTWYLHGKQYNEDGTAMRERGWMRVVRSKVNGRYSNKQVAVR
jgi:hypothetical protein